MNQVEIVCIIIAAVGAIFGICGLVFPFLSKKGINTGEILDKMDSGLDIAQKAVEGIKAIAPATPYISTAEAILDFTNEGVQKAEQLYKANQISADARKAEAIQLTKDLLTAAKVEVTPQIEKIIDGCVEAAVFTLPKTHAVAQPKSEAATSDTTGAV
ncbi:MAG TPA: hypothetical protein DG942_07865 [Ruminococcaceae bacterium]|jgi:hypothetical protein|nr:hypothetical protein [Oscillospiraceae bacterium]